MPNVCNRCGTALPGTLPYPAAPSYCTPCASIRLEDQMKIQGVAYLTLTHSGDHSNVRIAEKCSNPDHWQVGRFNLSFRVVEVRNRSNTFGGRRVDVYFYAYWAIWHMTYWGNGNTLKAMRTKTPPSQYGIYPA